MSVEAITWALNTAPVPDMNRPSRSAAAFVLASLAYDADPGGHGVFPDIARLVARTRLSARTVRMCLDVLKEHGLITPSGSLGWDLALQAAQA